MKKVIYAITIMVATSFAACGGGSQKAQETESADAVGDTPQYTVVETPQVDLSGFETDKDGYIVLF